MPVKDVVIRAQELGGRWTALGSDSARGIIVEDLTADADTWGSRSCSFTLRRNVRVPWPDIGAFAPLEIESQGLPVWSGRVKGTPTTDGSDRRITVNGEGWQYHLDDDTYQKNYVHADLSDWVDARGLLSTPLASYIQGTNVTVGNGVITLGYPNASPIPGGAAAGVTLDFGAPLCVQAVVNWKSSNNDAATAFTVRGSDVPDGGSTAGNDAFSFALNSGTAGSNSGTFATARRYIHMFINHTGALTPGADIWIQINLAWLMSSTAYYNAGSLFLHASDIVADALNKGTLLLQGSNNSKITATTFVVPDFAMSKPSTPRDTMNAANAFHNYQIRVGVDKLLEYRPQPASASIQVDARSTFDEASAGDASQIYSNAQVSFTDASGVSQVASRSQPSTAYSVSAIQPTNPSATVDTSSWTAAGGTLTRTTTVGEFTSAPGGFKMAVTALPWVASVLSAAWTGGTFIAGNAYRLTFDIRADSGTPAPIWEANIYSGGASLAVTTQFGLGSFVTGVSLDWVQPIVTPPEINIAGRSTGGVASFNYYFDNLVLYEAAPTVVNRRGFRRTYLLDTNMALTSAGAQQIADVFLAAHKTTPLKGSLVVTGHGTAKKTPSGVSMPVAELLLNAGELIRFIHLIDPDTGAIGREGRVAAVSWDATSNTATIEIDSQSQNFEAFIARLGIITGQVR